MMVLSWSWRFFKLQVGDKVDTFSTLRLTLQISPRRAGCAAAEAGPSAGRHGAASQARVIYTTHNPATTAATPPPRHLQLPSCQTTCTAAALPSFRPPSPQCRTPEMLHSQPRTPTASSAWGGAVERRHLMAALSISSLLNSYIFNQATSRLMFT
jgi:hypothetical protein